MQLKPVQERQEGETGQQASPDSFSEEMLCGESRKLVVAGRTGDFFFLKKMSAIRVSLYVEGYNPIKKEKQLLQERRCTCRNGVLEKIGRGEIQTRDGGWPSSQCKKTEEEGRVWELHMPVTTSFAGAYGKESFIQQIFSEPLPCAWLHSGCLETKPRTKGTPVPALRELSFQMNRYSLPENNAGEGEREPRAG